VIQNEEANDEKCRSTLGRRLFLWARGGRYAGCVIDACISRIALGIAAWPA
jgi:hypothetical protein